MNSGLIPRRDVVVWVDGRSTARGLANGGKAWFSESVAAGEAWVKPNTMPGQHAKNTCTTVGWAVRFARTVVLALEANLLEGLPAFRSLSVLTARAGHKQVFANLLRALLMGDGVGHVENTPVRPQIRPPKEHSLEMPVVKHFQTHN